MALLWCDSFDHISTADLSLKYTTNSGMQIVAGTGRNGTSCLTHSGDSSSESLTKILDAPIAMGEEIIMGFAYQNPSVAAKVLMTLQEGGTGHFDIRMDSNLRLQATRAGTVLGTGTTMLTLGYHYIEFKVTIHDTTGIVEVRLDGNTTPEITLTNQDTRNGGTGAIDRFVFFGPGSMSVKFDDMYLCDGTGSTNNDFLGDVRIQAILPNGNGNSSQLMGSDGNTTDNYLLVDEATQDGDTTYVGSATVGEKDTYLMGNLTPTTGTVHAVVVRAVARKSDAGFRSFNLVSRHSATEDDSSARTLQSTYQMFSEIKETKPGGGAWSISDVNAAEFGVKVAA